MPTTRKGRTSNGPGAKGSQKTLSFTNSKKVVKPSTPLGKDVKSPSPSLPKAVDLSLDTEAHSTTGHVSSEPAVLAQAKEEVERERTEEEERAQKVTDAQIRKYWRERENERQAARVHQEGLDVEEKILRLFDMSSQYGPCIGIARIKRWVRANKLALNPPIEVLAVLLKEEEKGNDSIERAHIDELMK